MNEMVLSISNKKQMVTGIEFLGETNSLITYSDLSTHFGVTQGAVNTTSQANKWLHFKIDGKELYVSKVAARNGISWDQLYSKGLVYGTDSNGLFPTGTPTNQLKTISIADKVYKCRLLKSANEGQDPYTHIPGIGNGYYDTPNSYTSEWSRLFYPIITNDPNAKSYIGPRLANYVEADLQMRYVSASTTPGAYNWCQERESSNSTFRVIRGYFGPSLLSWSTSSSTTTSFGWRACLELVS